jgi:hypothetical protein
MHNVIEMRTHRVVRPQGEYPLAPPANLYDSFAEALQPDLPTFRDYLSQWVESRIVVFFVGAYVGIAVVLLSAIVAGNL